MGKKAVLGYNIKVIVYGEIMKKELKDDIIRLRLTAEVKQHFF